MTQPSVFTIRADRLCRVRARSTNEDATPSVPLDEDGFLDGSRVSTSEGAPLMPGMLVTPATAASRGALVLLGEPGAGKSSAFDALTVGLPSIDEVDAEQRSAIRVNAVDLVDATFTELLGRYITSFPKASETDASAQIAGADARVTIVIDQLDESPMLRRIPNELRRAFRGRDPSVCQILVGCRTADYRPQMTDALVEIFGDCVLTDLAPLTKRDACELAENAGLDGEEFLTAVIGSAAGALASVPLTLELLVRTYRDSGTLPQHAAEVFNQGVRLLCSEHDSDRQRDSDSASTVDQRIAVAGRIAALLLLSGRRTIWTGPELGESSTDLASGTFASGSELTANGRFDVTAPLVITTLGTALFTGRGANRIAFRHSSIAAYLAARFVIEREIPEEQLRSLFLVATEDGNTSIPEPVREAAAWLATLDPQQGRWLADADPESLASHSNIVDTAAIREATVESLLARASEVELSGARWLWTHHNLSHPRLSEQLQPILESASNGQPVDWVGQARVRLAVRLARDGGAIDVVQPLVALVEHEGWYAHTRLLAAQSAFEIAPNDAAPRLTAVLETLADQIHAAEVDPDDELRGGLLYMLCPAYVSVRDVLVQLRPRAKSGVLGSYAHFLRELAGRVSDADLDVLLHWVGGFVQTTSDGSGIAVVFPESDDFGYEGNDVTPDPAIDSTLVDALIERALLENPTDARVEVVAAILDSRIEHHDAVSVPHALDWVLDDGPEDPESRELRHRVVLAIVRRMVGRVEVGPGHVWRLFAGWSSSGSSWIAASTEDHIAGHRSNIIDRSDFAWAIEMVDREVELGHPKVGRALSIVAARIFDPFDGSSVERAFECLGREAGLELKQFFDAVGLTSPEADSMRQAYEWSKPMDPHEPTKWAEVEPFRKRLQELLVRARNGEPDAFWQLCWDLQVDPTTGGGFQRNDENLLGFPSVTELDNGAPDALAEAAGLFLVAEHDRHGSWFGTGTYDKRAWAGYLALVLLQDRGDLDQLDETVWRRWCGAVIWFQAVPSNAGDPLRKAQILERAATIVPETFADAVLSYVRGEVNLKHSPSEVTLLDPSWSPLLGDAMTLLAEELCDQLKHPGVTTEGSAVGATAEGLVEPPSPEVVTARKQTWISLVRRLGLSVGERGYELAVKALDGATGEDPTRGLAIAAAELLLTQNSAATWPVVSQRFVESKFSHDLAIALATPFGDSGILAGLNEQQLDQVYRWLIAEFPNEIVFETGAGFISADQQIRTLQESVLRRLAEFGTDAAVLVLLKLSIEFPNRLSVVASLRSARISAHASAWSPPSPGDLSSLFLNGDRRIVRTSRELCDLLITILSQIEAGLPPHGELLWDRRPGEKSRTESTADTPETWHPKPEAALCAYVAHELMLRLAGRGVVVNREVLILPTNAYGSGERTDIFVQATMTGSYANTTAPEPMPVVAVVIEVKGCWHADLETAQHDQLALRYLKEYTADAGIYLIGWYPMDLWTASIDPPRRVAARRDRGTVMDALREQGDASGLELGKYLRQVGITIERPHSS